MKTSGVRTSGPWTIKEAKGQVIEIWDSKEKRAFPIVRFVPQRDISDTEQVNSDARLIATAPDMLQFLVALGGSRFWALYIPEAVEEARQQLLAKMEGH